MPSYVYALIVTLSGFNISILFLHAESASSRPQKFHSDSSSEYKCGHYRSLLNHYSQTGVIQSQTPYADDEEYEEGPSKRKCYKSNLMEVTLATNVVVRGGSKFLPSKQLSREEAAKDIVQQMVARGVVTLQQSPSGTVNLAFFIFGWLL